MLHLLARLSHVSWFAAKRAATENQLALIVHKKGTIMDIFCSIDMLNMTFLILV